MSLNVVTLLYLVASVCFIQALKGLSNPKTARTGNTFGMVGMAIAILTTIALIVDKKTGDLALNWDDDIVKGAGVTRDGEIVHPSLKG